MPATYERFGVKFLYPDNWKVTEEQLDDWPRSVSVQSPEGSYWQLHVYPTRKTPVKLADEVLAAMQQVYDGLEAEPVRESWGETAAVGHDMNFFCLDLMVTARVRGFYRGKHTCVLFCQAESRDFDRHELVFSAMTQSLLAE